MNPVVMEDVSYSYPDAATPALDRVSLSVPEGAFALVTGATGSGKSTLIRAMNGLVPHFTGGRFSGRVSIRGRDTLTQPPRALADVVGFVPQDPSAAFVVDRVEDELAYAMENLGVPLPVMRRRVEETLDLLAIGDLRGRSVRTLSGGERQRVAIAAALTAGPRLLLLDEPTSQLDPQGAEDVLAALRRLVDDLEMTVIIAEHRLERVAGFVDLAIGCLSGRVVVGSPAEILQVTETGPPVARLGRLAGWSSIPLTVKEARREVRRTETSPDAAAGHPDGDLGARNGSRARGGGGSPVLIETRGSGGSPTVRRGGLSAAYGSEVVLHGVRLTVAAGERVALIGRNGAGKTTLLRALAGVHAPASGRVVVPGVPPSSADHVPRPGVDVALCPQDPDTLLFRDSVLEEVDTTLRGLGVRGDSMSVLGSLDLADLAEHHPRDLSAGQRLLVAVAATVAAGAPVLLLDEPTRGLDPESKRRLRATIERLCSSGGAVVFASHDVELVAQIATRVVLLAGGEVVADGPAEILCDSPIFSPQMARVFGAPWLTPEQVAAALTPPNRAAADRRHGSRP
jgi:energy-coupling factor transport system ATP-binding protein